MDESTNREKKLTNHVAIWISLSVSVILVVHLFLLKIDAVGFSLVVLAVLPWLIISLTDYVKKLKLPGGVEVELRDEIKAVRQGLNETNERVSQLFLTTMAPWMYENLKKLASGHFGKYEMSQGLERELYHLRDIGYIEVTSIKNIPKNGEDLSLRVKITSTGQQFVDLRESLGNPHSRMQ